MTLAAAVTDLDQLKSHPAIARLLSWNPKAVEGVKFDRDEMTIYVERSSIREACALLRDDANCPFNFLSDVTCVDWYPSEPRFEVIYHLLSIPNKERVRLKVKLNGDGPAVDSITSLEGGVDNAQANGDGVLPVNIDLAGTMGSPVRLQRLGNAPDILIRDSREVSAGHLHIPFLAE